AVLYHPVVGAWVNIFIVHIKSEYIPATQQGICRCTVILSVCIIFLLAIGLSAVALSPVRRQETASSFRSLVGKPVHPLPFGFSRTFHPRHNPYHGYKTAVSQIVVCYFLFSES